MDHPTIADVVTTELRARVLRGELEPGADLNEAELAQDLRVSRTPVREAIRRLADEALAELIPRHCARVKQLTLKDVLELTELREALEVLAFRKLAPVITDEDLSRLGQIHEAYRSAGNDEDFDQAVELDTAFHRYIAEKAQNDRLMDFMRKVAIFTTYVRIRSYKKNALTPFRSQDHHVPLLDALASRDPDAAERAIRSHIANTRRFLESCWAQDGDGRAPAGEAASAPSSRQAADAQAHVVT